MREATWNLEARFAASCSNSRNVQQATPVLIQLTLRQASCSAFSTDLLHAKVLRHLRFLAVEVIQAGAHPAEKPRERNLRCRAD